LLPWLCLPRHRLFSRGGVWKEGSGGSVDMSCATGMNVGGSWLSCNLTAHSRSAAPWLSCCPWQALCCGPALLRSQRTSCLRLAPLVCLHTVVASSVLLMSCQGRKVRPLESQALCRSLGQQCELFVLSQGHVLFLCVAVDRC
jgi:hypothetical protein